jgi:hypothetical protein
VDHDDGELLLEAAQPLKGIFDRIEPFLKDDLLSCVLKLLAGEPASMRQRPMTAAAIDAAMTQQEGKHLLAFAAKVVGHRLARPDKIAHRFMRRVGAQTAVSSPARCSHASVTASRRFVLMRSPDRFGIQGRSDHHALVAERLDLAIKPVSRRPSFKADVQRVVSVREPLDRPLDRQRAVLDIAEKSDFAAPARFRVLLLRDIKSHKDFAMLSQGPPSVHEARLGSPEQPSFLTARKGWPPAQPANMTSRCFFDSAFA